MAARPAAARKTGQKLTQGHSIEHPCVGGGTHALVDKPHAVLHSSLRQVIPQSEEEKGYKQAK